jgi:hypothetical protein
MWGKSMAALKTKVQDAPSAAPVNDAKLHERVIYLTQTHDDHGVFELPKRGITCPRERYCPAVVRIAGQNCSDRTSLEAAMKIAFLSVFMTFSQWSRYCA